MHTIQASKENLGGQDTADYHYEISQLHDPDNVESIPPMQDGYYHCTIFFILFSTIGSGIIILPITMKNLGIFPATFLFAASAYISYFTVTQLVSEGFRLGKYYFADIVRENFNSSVLTIVDICFHVGNLLGVVVFNKISKKYI